MAPSDRRMREIESRANRAVSPADSARQRLRSEAAVSWPSAKHRALASHAQRGLRNAERAGLFGDGDGDTPTIRTNVRGRVPKDVAVSQRPHAAEDSEPRYARRVSPWDTVSTAWIVSGAALVAVGVVIKVFVYVWLHQ